MLKDLKGLERGCGFVGTVGELSPFSEALLDMTSLVSLTYAGKTQTVALFEGLSPSELTSVLQTVFGFSGDVVGILGEVGACLLFPVVFLVHIGMWASLNRRLIFASSFIQFPLYLVLLPLRKYQIASMGFSMCLEWIGGADLTCVQVSFFCTELKVYSVGGGKE